MCTVLTTAQIINNAVSYRSIQQPNYIRLTYDNDFFTATDKYYTQGINMEVVSPNLSKLPTKHILFHPDNATVQYGLGLQHYGFTPTDIQDASIRYGDRPYAAAIMLQPFTISTNSQQHSRLTSMLSLGVMGKIAGGQWMQETIHRNLDNAMPRGWQYQIANDVVLNYRLYYEKRLLHVNNILEVSATGLADAGTLDSKAGLGASIVLGYFESMYETQRNRKFGAYIYTHPQVYAVGYNATLQGGLFSKSVYTIPAGDVSRLVADNKFGIVFRYGGLYLEYYQAISTLTFRTGNDHAWGGVLIGVGF